MWRDIALANRKHLAGAVGSFISELQGFQKILKGANEETLEQFFETAKSRRDRWRAPGKFRSHRWTQMKHRFLSADFADFRRLAQSICVHLRNLRVFYSSMAK